MLIDIGHSYLHTKFQLPSSYRFRDMKVEISQSFQREKSTFSIRPIESHSALDDSGNSGFSRPPAGGGGFSIKSDRSQAFRHSVVSEK